MGKLLDQWDTILDKTAIKGKPHVDKLRLHDLRHTCATNLARAGKDIKLIAQYLGHADVKTTARYIHYQDEDLRAAARTLSMNPMACLASLFGAYLVSWSEFRATLCGSSPQRKKGNAN